MNFKQEFKKMNLSDLRWICKKLYIEYKQKDSKSILIKNLLSPLNRKYKMDEYERPRQRIRTSGEYDLSDEYDWSFLLNPNGEDHSDEDDLSYLLNPNDEDHSDDLDLSFLLSPSDLQRTNSSSSLKPLEFEEKSDVVVELQLSNILNIEFNDELEIFSAIIQSIISWLPHVNEENGNMDAIIGLFQKGVGRRCNGYQFLQTYKPVIAKRKLKNTEPPFMTYEDFANCINACQELMLPGQIPDSLDLHLEPLRPGLYNVGYDKDVVHYYTVIDLNKTGLDESELNDMFGIYGNNKKSNNIFDKDLLNGYIVVNGYKDGWVPGSNRGILNEKRFIGLDAQPSSGLCQTNAIMSMLACNGGGVQYRLSGICKPQAFPLPQVKKSAYEVLKGIKERMMQAPDEEDVGYRYLVNEWYTFKWMQNQPLTNIDMDFFIEEIEKYIGNKWFTGKIIAWLRSIDAIDNEEIVIKKLLEIILLDKHSKHFEHWSTYADHHQYCGDQIHYLMGEDS